MTVIVSKPAVNLREELASLRNQGGYQEQQFYFDSLVTNGTFDSDTSGWTANNTTLSVVSGKLKVENSTANYGNTTAPISLEVGKQYVLSFDFTKTTYDAVLAFNTASSGSSGSRKASITVSSSGSYSITWTADTASMYVAATVNSATSGAFFEIDNISVLEVDANDDVVHRMPKGWVPKDVYEDGLLQREGSAHDYEVVYDGFDYYVKPTVAPTATTQTCVIGVKA